VIIQQSPKPYKEGGKNDIRQGTKPYNQGGKYNNYNKRKGINKTTDLHQTKQHKSQQTTPQ
jgi:hypothetical protein